MKLERESHIMTNYVTLKITSFFELIFFWLNKPPSVSDIKCEAKQISRGTLKSPSAACLCGCLHCWQEFLLLFEIPGTGTTTISYKSDIMGRINKMIN